MKAILFSFFISCFTSLHSQISISNQSLTDSSLAFLYIGVDNIIVVSGLAANYTIAISGGAGSIQKFEKNKYVARVVTQSDTCQIKLLKGAKIVFRKEYKVRIVPVLIATINGFRDTSMKVSTLLVNPFISTHLPGCFLREKFTIFSFDATFIQDTDSTITHSQGASFSPEQIKLIKNLIREDKIYFDNIKGTWPGGRTVKLSSFWIRIE